MLLIRSLAIAGFALSAFVHFVTFFGIDPAEHIPVVWLLHVGIFIVCIPALVASNRLDKGSPQSDYWERILSHCPKWMRALLLVFFLYLPFNFFFSLGFLNEWGNPGMINGQRVLHNHGEVIKKLTPAEFRKHNAYVVRGFSGHWMFFYLASAAIISAGRSEAGGRAP